MQPVFSRGHATLYFAVPVRRSICCNIFEMQAFFLGIIAPAQPSATGAVYPALLCDKQLVKRGLGSQSYKAGQWVSLTTYQFSYECFTSSSMLMLDRHSD